MNICNATLFLYFLCLTFHICLSQISLFEKVSKRSTFVDKTHLLKPFFTKTNDRPRSILFTCPKGFGKSVNLDMIRRFAKIYQNHTEGNRWKDLFKNLKIGRDEEFLNKHFGKYAVIFIDLQTPATADTRDKIINNVRNATKRVYSEYKWLYEEHLKDKKNLSEAMKKGKKYFKIILHGEQSPESHNLYCKHGIEVLLEVIYTFYSKNIVILVDEYDSPILQAMMNGHDTPKIEIFKELIPDVVLQCTSFGVMYHNAFTLFITGISDNIGVKSPETQVESGENNNRFYYDTYIESDEAVNSWFVINKYNFLDNHDFYDFCGFTENEMENIVNKPTFHITKEEKLILKNCYNGYVSDKNSTRIYNPYYLVKDLTETKKTDPNKNIVKCKAPAGKGRTIFGKFHAYLKNECILSTVANLIRNHSFTFRKKHNISNFDLEKLQTHTEIRGRWISACESTFNIYFSLLFQYGYLTKVDTFWSFKNKTWYQVANDQITADLNATLTQYLKSYPNSESLFDVAKIFSNILSNQMVKEKTEEALKIALTKLFKPFNETADPSHEESPHEIEFHYQMYISMLYGYWIRNLFHIIDGYARIDRVARVDTKFRYFHRHSRKVNMLMESSDHQCFLFIEMDSDKISGIEQAKQLTSNLTYKSTLVLLEKHPEKLPKTLLHLSIKSPYNGTIKVEFLPPLHLVPDSRVTMNTDILAIYEEALA